MIMQGSGPCFGFVFVMLCMGLFSLFSVFCLRCCCVCVVCVFCVGVVCVSLFCCLCYVCCVCVLCDLLFQHPSHHCPQATATEDITQTSNNSNTNPQQTDLLLNNCLCEHSRLRTLFGLVCVMLPVCVVCSLWFV